MWFVRHRRCQQCQLSGPLGQTGTIFCSKSVHKTVCSKQCVYATTGRRGRVFALPSTSLRWFFFLTPFICTYIVYCILKYTRQIVSKYAYLIIIHDNLNSQERDNSSEAIMKDATQLRQETETLWRRIPGSKGCNNYMVKATAGLPLRQPCQERGALKRWEKAEQDRAVEHDEGQARLSEEVIGNSLDSRKLH
jgi:hypothetical protein